MGDYVSRIPMLQDASGEVLIFCRDNDRPGSARDQFQAAIREILARAIEDDRKAWAGGVDAREAAGSEPDREPAPATTPTSAPAPRDFSARLWAVMQPELHNPWFVAEIARAWCRAAVAQEGGS